MAWQGYKECFAPFCKNNTKSNPNKVFIRLREDLKSQWCLQVNAVCFKHYLMYCCEDHLNLEEDLKNYKKFKLGQVEPMLKPNAKLHNIKNTTNEARNKEMPSTSTWMGSELFKLLNKPVLAETPKRRKLDNEGNILPSASGSIVPLKMETATMNHMQYRMGFSHRLVLTPDAVPTKFPPRTEAVAESSPEDCPVEGEVIKTQEKLTNNNMMTVDKTVKTKKGTVHRRKKAVKRKTPNEPALPTKNQIISTNGELKKQSHIEQSAAEQPELCKQPMQLMETYAELHEDEIQLLDDVKVECEENDMDTYLCMATQTVTDEEMSLDTLFGKQNMTTQTVEVISLDTSALPMSRKKRHGNEMVCCTCLRKRSEVKQAKKHWKTMDSTLGALLHEVTGVVHAVPRALCPVCARRLRAAAAFRRQAIRAHTMLIHSEPLHQPQPAITSHRHTDPNTDSHDLWPREESEPFESDAEMKTIIVSSSDSEHSEISSTADRPQLHEQLGKPDHHSDIVGDNHSDIGADHHSDIGADHHSNVGPDHHSDIGPDHHSDIGPDHHSDIGSDDFYWPETENFFPQRERRKLSLRQRRESFCNSLPERELDEPSTCREERDGSWEPDSANSAISDSESSSVENDDSNKIVNKSKKKKYVARPKNNNDFIPKQKKRIIKKFQCLHCGLMFRSMEHLKIHMRRHTGERPYKCSDCGRGFTSKATLNNHKQVHAPKAERVRSFICDICGRSFYQKKYISTHMSTHLNTAYVCQSCGHAFAWKANLKAHRKRVHGEETIT